MIRTSLSVTLIAAAFASSVHLLAPAFAQPDSGQRQCGSEQGQPGSTEGSPGMEEEGEPPYLKRVQQAKKKGVRNVEYVRSLLGLGMLYNRQERFADAQRVLTEALALVDAGVIKPSPHTEPRQPIIETHVNGTVSATNTDPPKPYEELMQDLLPGLVQAEIANRKFKLAETHIKRQIALVPSNQVTGSVNLMSAYSSYANLLRKLGRTAEAKTYDAKADAINRSFIPM